MTISDSDAGSVGVGQETGAADSVLIDSDAGSVGSGQETGVADSALTDLDSGSAQEVVSADSALTDTEAGSGADVGLFDTFDSDAGTGSDGGGLTVLDGDVGTGDDEPVIIVADQVDWIVGEIPIDVFGLTQIYPVPSTHGPYLLMNYQPPPPAEAVTTDGVTWTVGSNPFGPSGIVSQFATSGDLVVAVGHSSDYMHTISISTDRGQSWHYPAVDPLVDTTTPNGANAAVVLIHNGRIWVGGSPSNQYMAPLAYSDDNGATWTTVPDPVPNPYAAGAGLRSVNALAAEGTLIAVGGSFTLHGTSYFNGSTYPMMQISADGGSTWTQVNWTRSGTSPNYTYSPTFGSTVSCLLVKNGVVYIGSSNGSSSNTAANFAFSSDHGATWTSVPASARGNALNNTVEFIFPLSDGTLLVGGTGGSNFAKYNPTAATWSAVTDNSGFSGAWGVAEVGGTLYFYGGSSGASNVGLSTDNGNTWNLANVEPDPTNANFSAYVIIGVGSTVILAGTRQVVGNVPDPAYSYATSTDGGTTWAYHSTDPFIGGQANVAASGVSGSTPYVVMFANGYSRTTCDVARTYDGVSWSPFGEPLGFQATVQGLVTDGALLAVIAGYSSDNARTIAISTDAGTTWSTPSPDPLAFPFPLTPDASSGAHEGKVGAGVTLVSPLLTGFGQAMQFTAKGGVIAPGVPHISGVGAAGVFTLECMAALAPGVVNGNIAGWYGPSDNYSYEVQLYVQSSTLYFYWYDDTGSFWSLSHSLTDQLEHWIAVDYDGTTMRLYVDGTMVASQATTGVLVPSATAPDFGIGTDQNGDNFAGTIDEVRLSGVARYASDTGYTPAAAPFTPDADTQALFHLDTVTPGVNPGIGQAQTVAVVNGVILLGASTYSGSGPLAISRDQGATWEYPTTALTYIQAIASEGNLIAVIGTGSALMAMISTDGGTTWSDVPADLGGSSPSGVAVRGGVIYVVGGTTLAISSDNGATWSTTTPTTSPAMRYISGVHVLADGTVLVAGSGTYSGQGTGGPTVAYYRSGVWGQPDIDPFQNPTTAPGPPSPSAYGFVEADGGVYVLGNGITTAAFSTDSGTTWTSVDADPGNHFHISAIIGFGTDVFASGSDALHPVTYAISGDGSTWALPSADPFEGGQGAGLAVGTT